MQIMHPHTYPHLSDCTVYEVVVYFAYGIAEAKL